LIQIEKSEENEPHQKASWIASIGKNIIP
jgi:hypothetical protein